MTIGRIVGSLVAGAALAAGIWLLGVDAWFAAALGCLLALVCVAWFVLAGAQTASAKWPQRAIEPRLGARTDVSWLAWAFHQNKGSVREQGLAAVRALAVRRLARRGLDLLDPCDRDDIVALLGEDAYRTITPAGGIMPSLRAVERCLDAVEALEGPRPS